MKNSFVFLSPIKVYDEKIFTKERAKKWKIHIRDSYKCVLEELRSKMDSSSMIDFFICKSLVDEVIVDAIIGMRKITDSKYNSIEDPNSFKVISYLAYWFLRHKPVSLYYPSDSSLSDVLPKKNSLLSESQQKEEKQKLIWQLKHINELVAVQMVFTYIFDFDKKLCGQGTCNRLKRKEREFFCFDNFDQMKNVIIKKLTYYFCYRTIAPKVIEHILEAYTFHPAWGLTGNQWRIAQQDGESP